MDSNLSPTFISDGNGNAASETRSEMSDFDKQHRHDCSIALNDPSSATIMTRHRKHLLTIQHDIEAGRSVKHAVPYPSSNDDGGSSNYNQATNGGDSGYAPSDAFSAPERWMERSRQTFQNKKCQDWISTLLPMYGWMRTYQWRQFLPTDIIAGLTVGVMVIPQSMSYAKLAGLPVEFGLYSSLVPIYAYAVFGSSRQLAIGPVALVSLLLSSGLTTALEGQGKTPENTENYDTIYATMALQASFLVGVFNIFMGVFKLGFIANFLSHAVISGFTSGAAIIIGFSQVKFLFGYNVPNVKSLQKMIYNIFANISEFNWKTFVLGTSCVLVLIGLKYLSQHYPKFKWTKALGPLLVTVISIALQAILDLESLGIPIVGYIPEGLPNFTGALIFPMDFGALTLVVLTIVMIGFMESIAIAKKLAQKHNYELDASMELLGLGMANLSSGLFGGYPVTGSFSRSAVNNDSGAKSGVSGLVTATMVAFTLLFLTSVFELLPLATLASIVISGVISLVDYPEAIFLWRVHKFDFCVWMAAFLGTLFLGAELGLGLAVGISLLLVLFESAYPPTAELGRLPGTHQYRDIKQYPDAQTYDGIVCVRVDAPMYFANTQHIRDKVLKYYLRAEEQLSNQHNGETQNEVPRVQFIVLDLSPVAQIDTSALHVMQEMYTTFKKTNDIQLCLANPNPRVMHRLVSSGLADEIGRDRIFVSLYDAVDNCLQQMDTFELKRHYNTQSECDSVMGRSPGKTSVIPQLHAVASENRMHDISEPEFSSLGTTREGDN